MHYRTPNAKAIEVSVRFNNGGHYDKEAMAIALADFISSHKDLADPVATFYKGFPRLFFSVTIATFASGRAWWSGECGGYTVSDVYEQLALRISEKNNRLQAYRANLPNVPIWLLVYTGVAVSRGMSIPYGIGQWKQPFGFDKVLFFSCLEREVVEILPEVENRFSGCPSGECLLGFLSKALKASFPMKSALCSAAECDRYQQQVNRQISRPCFQLHHKPIFPGSDNKI